MTKEQPLMNGVECVGFGGAEVLKYAQRPRPYPQQNEVLIKVAGIGMNRADILQRKGLYPPPHGTSDLLGLEISGIIEGTGERVCTLLAGGGYAEYVTVARDLCFSVPDHINLIDAAGLPEAMMTVAKNIFILGNLKKDDHVLIHGGASGIGTMAIQMAHYFGARVSVTAGSDIRCEKCLELGATRAINYKQNDFTKILKDDGADVVLDMVGGETYARSLSVLKNHGRMISIAYLENAASTISIPTIMKKNLTLTGSTLRADSLADKVTLANYVRTYFWDGVISGKIKPVIDQVFSLKDAQKAHESFEKGQHFGKILLSS